MDLRRLRAFVTGRTDNEFNPDHVALGRNDFRRTRTFLAPHVFASGGDLPDPRPTELISRERWEHVMHLADDVALRSSSYSGASTARMSDLAYAWLRALPDNPDDAPFMHQVALGAFEEFEATTFIALHGFYRQALGSLRNAIELMTHAAALAVEQDHARFADWRAASVELRFQQSRATLARHATTLERNVQPAVSSLISREPGRGASTSASAATLTPRPAKTTPRSGRATAPSTVPRHTGRRSRSFAKWSPTAVSA